MSCGTDPFGSHAANRTEHEREACAQHGAGNECGTNVGDFDLRCCGKHRLGGVGSIETGKKRYHRTGSDERDGSARLRALAFGLVARNYRNCNGKQPGIVAMVVQLRFGVHAW